MISYSKSSGLTSAAIGKLETPIKMIIEHESDLITKKGGIATALFNIEKSNRFGETIVGGNEFDIFVGAEEGEFAEQDFIAETYSKFIEHIQYMKEFVISAQMMEDANYGIAADTKRRAENFARAYHKTINKICEFALMNGTSESGYFAALPVDLTAPDGLPLFNNAHKWGSAVRGISGTQSNYFYGNVFSTGAASARTPSAEVFEDALSKLSVKIRNMKDENGSPLGYTADTIIIPGNRPKLESIVKKVCGSESSVGAFTNEVNLHYGMWNVVILPNWQTTDDRIMIMSSEANKNLCGNMFFNRVPLTVSNWVDHHTGNYVWTGRCRFGVGFGSYKHILLAVDSASAVSDSELLD